MAVETNMIIYCERNTECEKGYLDSGLLCLGINSIHKLYQFWIFKRGYVYKYEEDGKKKKSILLNIKLHLKLFGKWLYVAYRGGWRQLFITYYISKRWKLKAIFSLQYCIIYTNVEWCCFFLYKRIFFLKKPSRFFLFSKKIFSRR